MGAHAGWARAAVSGFRARFDPLTLLSNAAKEIRAGQWTRINRWLLSLAEIRKTRGMEARLCTERQRQRLRQS